MSCSHILEQAVSSLSAFAPHPNFRRQDFILSQTTEHCGLLVSILPIRYLMSSVQFSRSVMSNSLQPHGLQHTSLPCPSPNPRACSNSCPSSWWRHPTISSSVVSFSSCLQSFPAPGSFQMSQFFTSGGQSIRVLASTSVLPMNIQDLFPLGWTGWISLKFKRLSRVFYNTTVQKHHSSAFSLCGSTLTSTHDYCKNHSFD